ncbi:hypothetical protein D9M68_954390 [compost metagenome]
MHDAAMPLCSHHRNDAACQIMPTEEIGFELRTQCFNRQILNRAGLCISTIVEQRIQLAVGCTQHFIDQRFD